MQNTAPQSTTTDLAISVAWKTAVFVLPIAGIAWFFGSSTFPFNGNAGSVSLAIATYFVARMVAKAEFRKSALDLTSDAFLSTVFYYGISVCANYGFRMAMIIVHMVSWNPGSGESGLLAFFGLESFSVQSVLLTLFFSHLPYVAYYLAVRINARQG